MRRASKDGNDHLDLKVPTCVFEEVRDVIEVIQHRWPPVPRLYQRISRMGMKYQWPAAWRFALETLRRRGGEISKPLPYLEECLKDWKLREDFEKKHETEKYFTGRYGHLVKGGDLNGPPGRDDYRNAGV